MQVRIVNSDEWTAIFNQWQHEAVNYSDDLGYIPKDMYTKEGEIIVVFDNQDNALLAMHTQIAQLPKTKGKTLRSTHASYSPALEFNEYNQSDILIMYTKLIKFVYNHSIDKKCKNVKVYTPRELDMDFWTIALSLLSISPNSQVIHQGKWATLLDNI